MKFIKKQEAIDLISELTILKEKFLALGFIKTWQQLDIPIKTVGWELADMIEGKYQNTKIKDLNDYKHFIKHINAKIRQVRNFKNKYKQFFLNT